MSLLHRSETSHEEPAPPDDTTVGAAESAKLAARQAREAAEDARELAEAAEAEAARIEEDEAIRRAASKAADAAEAQARIAEEAAAAARMKATELRASVSDGSATASTGASEVVDLTKDTSADTEGPAPRLRRIRRGVRAALTRRTAGFGVAVIVLAALCVVSGLMIVSHQDAADSRSRAAQFSAAARQGVLNITSLDYRNARRDVQRITADSSGAFADDFAQRSDAFITVVEQSKVVTVGSVTATGVESMTDNSAVVLVAANSTVTNAAGAKEEPRIWRLRVDVTRSGSRYSMSKVEFVP